MDPLPVVVQERLVGACPAMRRVLAVIERVAASTTSVLLVGETGTGKELLARLIHRSSGRRHAPLVALDATRLAEAPADMEQAAGGTLYLDEIGDAPRGAQSKLLSFLQKDAADVRIIAGSTRDLRTDVAAGRLHGDLYYRIGVVTLALPPLRERGEDVLLLAETFLRRFRREENRRDLRGFSLRAVEAMRAHWWPGNVRELDNRVRRAVIVTPGPVIDAEDLALGPPATASLDLRTARSRLERQLMTEALARSRGNITRAAAEIGVSRPTFHALMNRLGLSARGLQGTR